MGEVHLPHFVFRTILAISGHHDLNEMTVKSNIQFQGRRLEKTVAVSSFVVACVFAFVSLYLADFHEVAAGNCTIVAQFLLLTASLFGIDYKLNSYGATSPRPKADNEE